ncbi:hypothetical protein F5Y13DRAFT_205839 [Hypoxylon sp. FL1857]|nr:hypothetical protein F5Y13DRAFT_205839 [Hypoxylon sp. FL1857]
MPRKNGAAGGEYGTFFNNSRVSKPTFTINDHAKLAETARDPRYAHLFQNKPDPTEEALSAWRFKSHLKRPPKDDEDNEDDEDDDNGYKFSNAWVEERLERRTAQRSEAAKNSDLRKLNETANDPRYAHLFSHLRRPGSEAGPAKATIAKSTRPAPKPTQPQSKYDIDDLVISDSELESDHRPHKRFTKRFTKGFAKRGTLGNSDDDGVDSDGCRRTRGKGAKKFGLF